MEGDKSVVLKLLSIYPFESFLPEVKILEGVRAAVQRKHQPPNFDSKR